MSLPPILSCLHLSKHYDAPVFSDFNLALPCGKIIGLLGPNGSGKSTLIKLAAGLLTADGGQILIGGIPPCERSKSIVAYLPERNSLPEWMNVRQLLRFFADFFEDFDTEAAIHMLSDLQIRPSVPIRTLSKGTKEKVQLILVMARRARLYLLDEPIGGVDPATRDYILRTIIQNYHKESTILISTHLIADVEPILDDFLFLKNGEIVRSGNVKEFCAETGMSLDEAFRRDFRC